MADYWKSMDKKYCDVCKCWITDNKASVAFHENGNRHKMNVQQKLRDIHKKNKEDMKTEKKFQREMQKIDQAAQAASAKDMEANPDVSMKIQTYYNMLKEDAEKDGKNTEEPSTSKSSQPTILHRSDKQKKADETVISNFFNKPVKTYNRLGGWENPGTSAIGKNYLELPTKSSKSPGAALTLSAKVQQEKPIAFGEKRAVSTESSSSSSVLKPEPGGEVLFKKRKLNKGSMRQRDGDE